MSTKRKVDGHSKAANRPQMLKSGGLRAESERDSGFSDASSEHMSTMDTTDSEDSPHPAVQQVSGTGPQPSQLAMVGGSYSSLSPMIIMNNVLLKQPGDNPPALKPWGFSPTVEVVQPVVQQPQVVFIQPVVSHQASSASKDHTSRHRRPKKFLPILKAYPKIAPHPGDSCSSSSSSGRGTALLSSSSSSSSSGSDRGSSLTSNHVEPCQRAKRPRGLSGSTSNSGSAAPSLPTTPSTRSPLPQSRLSLPTPDANTSSSSSSNSSSPARERPSSTGSQSEFTTSLSFTHSSSFKKETAPVPQVVSLDNISPGDYDHNDSNADIKRKRFCNTYNILSKSGLLDITLRTKELLRQNRRTQNDLDQLKEHTDLFLQALKSGDTCVLFKLQARLQEEDKEGKSSSEQLNSRLDLD